MTKNSASPMPTTQLVKTITLTQTGETYGIKTDTCKDCKNWKREEGIGPEAKPFGLCRRFPRVIGVEGDVDKWLFPMQFNDDWCGEFIPSQ